MTAFSVEQRAIQAWGSPPWTAAVAREHLASYLRKLRVCFEGHRDRPSSVLLAEMVGRGRRRRPSVTAETIRAAHRQAALQRLAQVDEAEAALVAAGEDAIREVTILPVLQVMAGQTIRDWCQGRGPLSEEGAQAYAAWHRSQWPSRHQAQAVCP